MRQGLRIVLVGVAAYFAVFTTLTEPGITVDEPINASVGARMAYLIIYPEPLFTANRVQQIWGGALDHPPLTRLVLGVSSRIFTSDDSQFASQSVSYSPIPCRPASALAYALIIAIIGLIAQRSFGDGAGLAAAISCAILPRLFGHAHFASPEVIHALFMLLALLAAGWAFGDRPTIVKTLLAGIVMGCALLTKLTAVLVPLAVIPLVLWRHRWKGVLPLLAWGVMAWVTVFVYWPWLWPFDLPGYSPGWMGSLERLLGFLGRASDRATIYTWYFGKQYADTASPWHYVWVYFAITVPVGLHVLAGWGAWAFLRHDFTTPADGVITNRFTTRLLLAFVGVTLAFFTLPINRYDGERLFLFAFPCWMVFAGGGARWLWELLKVRIGSTAAVVAVGLLLASQLIGLLRTHPYQLSYHNLLVGGLPGAEALGLEINYWGDALGPELLNQWEVARQPGEQAVLLPTLHVGHAFSIPSSSTQTTDTFVVPVVPPDSLALKMPPRWALVFRRQSYLSDAEGMAAEVLGKWEVVAEVKREGVWLSRLYRRPEP